MAKSRNATKGAAVQRITPKVSRLCTQTQPARNHHCVLTVPFGGIDIDDTADLPCAPSSCHVNLVMSAWHKKAKSKSIVAIGGFDDGKIDHKGRGSIAIARYRPGALPRPQPLVDDTPAEKRLPVVGEGKDVKPEVVYSVPIRQPRAGETMVIEGRFGSSIKHLDYDVRTRSQLIFAGGPRTSKTEGGSAAGKVAETSIDLDEQNNFNCTRKSSGHKSPCPIRKVGILEIRNSSNKTFYVNLIAGHGALLVGNQKWRKSDAAKVGGKLGRVEVRRYGP